MNGLMRSGDYQIAYLYLAFLTGPFDPFVAKTSNPAYLVLCL